MLRQFEISTGTNSATDMRRYEARARAARAIVLRSMFSAAGRVAVHIATAVVGGSGARLDSEGKHYACARGNEIFDDRIPADSGLSVDDRDAAAAESADVGEDGVSNSTTA